MATTKAIPADVLATLNAGTFENDVYKLPPHRFSRERYTQLAEVINNAGGKWNRKEKGFTFKASPEAFRRALGSGQTVNVQQVTQFFPTPQDVADKMACCLRLKDRMSILEPSAGHGALIDAVYRRASAFNIRFDRVLMVEKDEDNAKHLESSALLRSLEAKANAANSINIDFLSMQLPAKGFFFDAVIMNPPFTRGSDIEHILRAWEWLKVGGELVALCANGPKQREKLKPWVESLGGTWSVLPSGTFKDSGDKGTSIETVLLTAHA